ncbi:MAG: hypothetical protein R3D25_10110 [Geminicoccaceae bacterium]
MATRISSKARLSAALLAILAAALYSINLGRLYAPDEFYHRSCRGGPERDGQTGDQRKPVDANAGYPAFTWLVARSIDLFRRLSGRRLGYRLMLLRPWPS